MSDLNASMSFYYEPENTSNSDTSTQIHLTEIIEEIQNLLERGAFKVILKEDITTDSNVLPGRFFLAIKSTEDGEIKFKTRYVIDGHRDKEKNMMVHTATTLQPQYIRILSLANIHDFDIWTSDSRPAYMQSSDPLDREIFIKKPVPEFELDPNECLQLQASIRTVNLEVLGTKNYTSTTAKTFV